MVGYIFGGEGMPKTPQELEQMRAVARSMARNRTPQNVGEGIASIGDAILSRVMMSRADAAQKAGEQSVLGDFSGLTDSLFTPTTPDISSTVPRDTATAPQFTSTQVKPIEGTMQNARATDRGSVQDYAGMTLKSGIKSAADALGISAEDLATAISYETAGTFDPLKKGPTTKWGQHKGLIQFGEPQAVENGVNWDDPLNSQLGPDGAVVKYLRKAGVKPGMGLLDVYSAINAGGVNRYDASDANNGGAWGTVKDKVDHQMDGHRQKALALFADDAQKADAFAAQPKLDQVPVVPVPEGFEKPVQVADNSDYFPPAPQKRVAQALGNSDATRKALNVLNNPFANPGQRAVAQAYLKRHFDEQDRIAAEEAKRNDPKYKLDLEKGQLELNALKNPPKSRTLTDDEEKARGLDPAGVYQMDKNDSITTVQAPEKSANEWAKLDDNRLYNQKTGVIKDVKTDQVVGFRFPGNSVEASALNGLIDNGTITEKQAMDIAAGKQLTGPNGEIIFATPQALIGGGQQPSQEVDIFAGEKPVDAAPTNQLKDGMVPLTSPKTTLDERKAMTFADRMVQSGALIDQMGIDGTSRSEQFAQQWAPFGLDSLYTSDNFKKLDQAKRDFINAQLRRESGATIQDTEFDNANKQYFPQPGDPPELIEQKKRNRQTVIDGMVRDGGPTYNKPKVELPAKNDEKLPPKPDDVTEEEWKHMSPEDRKLWLN